MQDLFVAEWKAPDIMCMQCHMQSLQFFMLYQRDFFKMVSDRDYVAIYTLKGDLHAICFNPLYITDVVDDMSLLTTMGKVELMEHTFLYMGTCS